MILLSDTKFKITTINILKCLIEKVSARQKVNISREMEILIEFKFKKIHKPQNKQIVV